MRTFVSKNSKMLKALTGREDGSAIVIALLVMVLLMGFVVLAISRTNSETISSANDAAETKAFDASHASLEVMTRNFNKIFEVKLNPDAADLANVSRRHLRDLLTTTLQTSGSFVRTRPNRSL